MELNLIGIISTPNSIIFLPTMILHTHVVNDRLRIRIHVEVKRPKVTANS